MVSPAVVNVLLLEAAEKEVVERVDEASDEEAGVVEVLVDGVERVVEAAYGLEVDVIVYGSNGGGGEDVLLTLAAVDVDSDL